MCGATLTLAVFCDTGEVADEKEWLEEEDDGAARASAVPVAALAAEAAGLTRIRRGGPRPDVLGCVGELSELYIEARQES